MSFTLNATGLTGSVVGGIPATFIPTTVGYERFAVGAGSYWIPRSRDSSVPNRSQAGVG